MDSPRMTETETVTSLNRNLSLLCSMTMSIRYLTAKFAQQVSPDRVGTSPS